MNNIAFLIHLGICILGQLKRMHALNVYDRSTQSIYNKALTELVRKIWKKEISQCLRLYNIFHLSLYTKAWKTTQKYKIF